MPGDTCPYGNATELAIIEIKEVIQPVTGERLLGSDDEFLIDTAFPPADSINLAHGKTHGMSQL